jgi:ribonuclease HII
MLVCGIDEVGKGAVAGPLYIVAAVFDCGKPKGIDIRDSKAMTEGQRELAFDPILECSVSVGLGAAWPDEINKDGIDNCWYECVRRALRSLSVLPDRIVIDGDAVPEELAAAAHVLVKPKADRDHWQVSAASILAKVLRDSVMTHLSGEFPGYDWNNNKGYLTPKHKAGLRRLGACDLHRMWKGVREYAR